jgi:hypothetical protein
MTAESRYRAVTESLRRQPLLGNGSVIGSSGVCTLWLIANHGPELSLSYKFRLGCRENTTSNSSSVVILLVLSLCVCVCIPPITARQWLSNLVISCRVSARCDWLLTMVLSCPLHITSGQTAEKTPPPNFLCRYPTSTFPVCVSVYPSLSLLGNGLFSSHGNKYMQQ